MKGGTANMLEVHVIDSDRLVGDNEHIICNDAWFLLHNSEYKFDDIVKDIVRAIDGVDILDGSNGNKYFYSKFCKDVPVDIDGLSTGCKTALNIYFNPEKAFYIGECGKNASDVIMKFNDGRVIVNHSFVPPLNVRQTYKIVFNGHETISNSYFDLLRVFEKLWR